MELTDRNIVITGAGSGIGRAVAQRFAAEQPRGLVLADINLAAVEAVAEEVGGLAVQVDVSREADIRKLVDSAREFAGLIDLFYSNAGIGGPGGGPEAPDDELQRTWEINVMAHIWAARAVLPEMVERGEGYLVSTASAAGLLTQVSALAYSITKHAAVAAAEWIAMTYGDAGIKVSCRVRLASVRRCSRWRSTTRSAPRRCSPMRCSSRPTSPRQSSRGFAMSAS